MLKNEDDKNEHLNKEIIEPEEYDQKLGTLLNRIEAQNRYTNHISISNVLH